MLNILTKIKGLFDNSISWLTLGTNAYAIYRLSKSYPGVQDESILREWMKDVCRKGGDLSKMTTSEIDDRIVSIASQLIDDDKSWGYIYSLIIKSGFIRDIPDTWDDPDSALQIISAIGLLTSLIQKIREKNCKTELSECYRAQKTIKNKINLQDKRK